MPTAFDIHEHRVYPGGWTVPNISTHLYHLLGHHHFHVSVHATSATSIFVHARKHGLHANFIPVLKMTLVHNPTQGWIVSVHYMADIRIARAIGFGILTGGISTLVGAGTLSAHAHDAECFVHSVFASLDSVSSSGQGRPIHGSSVPVVAFPQMPQPAAYVPNRAPPAAQQPQGQQPQGPAPTGIYPNTAGAPPPANNPNAIYNQPAVTAAPVAPARGAGAAGAAATSCAGCGNAMEATWKACPNCGKMK